MSYKPLLAFALLVVGNGAQGLAADDPVIRRLFAGLKARQDAAKTVRVRVDGERLIPKGSYTDDWGRKKVPADPPEDIRIKLRREDLFDFENTRRRSLIEERHPDGKLQSWRTVLSGDTAKGTRLNVPFEQLLTTPVSPPKTITTFHGLRKHQYQSDMWPYFIMNGFILCSRDDHYYEINPKPPLRPEEVYVHRVVGNDVLIRTYPVGSGKQAAYFEYGIHSASTLVTIFRSIVSDKTKYDITLSYGKEGVLKYWIHTWYDADGGVLNSEKMNVLSVDRLSAQADAVFDLTPQSGVVVQRVDYPTSGDIADPEPESRKFMQATPDGLIDGEVVNGEFRPTGSRRRWVWGLAGLVAASLAYLIVRRVWRRPADASVAASE